MDTKPQRPVVNKIQTNKDLTPFINAAKAKTTKK